MTRYRFTTLGRPCRAPDGDTIHCDRLDFGQGHVLVAPRRAPWSLRLVGPNGGWFDAAERTGHRAVPEGNVAAGIMREALDPVIAGGLWLAFETFPVRDADTRDSFGRYLYFPYAVVDPELGWKQSPFDIIGTLVAAGVARLGGRFGDEERA